MSDPRIEALRASIVAQADAAGADGWMEIPVDRSVRGDGLLRVPRGAFERWAVRPTGGEHLAAQWRPISPRGIKSGADDPYHTDWLLGAGFGPRDMRHDGPDPALTAALNHAAFGGKAEVERRLLGFDCSVLLSGPDVRGRVWHPRSPADTTPPWSEEPPIAVLRDARPDWLPTVLAVIDRGGAVVVERGGEMAHLVTLLRGEGKGPLVRMPGALRLYPADLVLDVSPGSGRITVADDARPPPDTGTWMPDPPKLKPGAPGRQRARAADGGYVLEACGTDNPADRLPYLCLEKCWRTKGVGFEALAVVSSANRDMPVANHGRGEVVGLVVRIFDDAHRMSRNYYAGHAAWTFDEIREATLQALYLHAPKPDYEAARARRRAEEQAREDAFRGRLAAMDDGALAAYANEQVALEARFLAECDKGKWDHRDRIDIEADYAQVFSFVDEEIERRGIERDPREREAASLPSPA